MQVIRIKHDGKRPETFPLADGISELKTDEDVFTRLEELLQAGDGGLRIQCPQRLNANLKDERTGIYFIISNSKADIPNMLASVCFNFKETVSGDAYVVSMDTDGKGGFTGFNFSQKDIDEAMWQINGYADILMLLANIRD